MTELTEADLEVVAEKLTDLRRMVDEMQERVAKFEADVHTAIKQVKDQLSA